MREQTKKFFETVTKSGSLFSSKHLSIRVISEKSLKSEIRIIVSKKVASSAVSRNRIRRRIRGLFGELDLQSVQIVLYTKKGVETMSIKELRKEVIYLIKKYKL